MGADWDRQRFMPTSYSGSALSRLLTEDEDFINRKYFNGRPERSSSHRRSSDGGVSMMDLLMDVASGSRTTSRSYDPRVKNAHYDDVRQSLSRKPRSWHPSPYGSDEEFIEEDDILTREAKKQRIKAEIARRRQQIDQNSRLHDELLRLSKLRESGDVIATFV